MSLTKDQSDSTHIKNFEEFLQDFNLASKAVLPSEVKRYTNVSVLLFRWEEDDLGTESEISDLNDIFRNSYHYNTQEYHIPSVDSERQLEDCLVSWRKADDGDGTNLLILYYGGHGKLDMQWRLSRSIWTAKNSNNSPSLVWSNIQSVLHRCESDVLLILDCCFAATAAQGVGATEGLWACSSQAVTPTVNDNSFTRNMIQVLKDLCGTRYNVVILHQYLMTRYKKQGVPKLLTEPWYTYLGSKICPSAELIPHHTLPSIPPSPSMIIPASETVVLLGVRLKDMETIPDLQS